MTFMRITQSLLAAATLCVGGAHAAPPLSVGAGQACTQTLECKLDLMCLGGTCGRFTHKDRGGACLFHRECRGSDKCVEGVCNTDAAWLTWHARRPAAPLAPPLPTNPNLQCARHADCADSHRCLYGYCVEQDTWNHYHPPVAPTAEDAEFLDELT
jgi:hypothetical protein